MKQITLEPGETIVYEAKIHWFCYVFPLALLGLGLMITFAPPYDPDQQGQSNDIRAWVYYGIAYVKSLIPEKVLPFFKATQELRVNYISILLISVGILKLIFAYISRNLSHYFVTTKRIIAQPSIFSGQIHEISLERLGNVRIHYGMLGKQIGKGTVAVDDSGMKVIELRHLSKPKVYQQAIQVAAKKYRQQKRAS